MCTLTHEVALDLYRALESDVTSTEISYSEFFENENKKHGISEAQYNSILGYLSTKGYILLCVQPGVTGYTIIFADHDGFYTELYDKPYEEKQAMQSTTNVSINNNAGAINVAGGDIRDSTVNIQQADLEKVVELLKELHANHPEKDGKFNWVRTLLESGKSLIDIVSEIAKYVP